MIFEFEWFVDVFFMFLGRFFAAGRCLGSGFSSGIWVFWWKSGWMACDEWMTCDQWMTCDHWMSEWHEISGWVNECDEWMTCDQWMTCDHWMSEWHVINGWVNECDEWMTCGQSMTCDEWMNDMWWVNEMLMWYTYDIIYILYIYIIIFNYYFIIIIHCVCFTTFSQKRPCDHQWLRPHVGAILYPGEGTAGGWHPPGCSMRCPAI